MTGITLGLALAATLPARADDVLSREADAFGVMIGNLAADVSAQSVYPVSANQLALAAVEELFAVVGTPVPTDLRDRLKGNRPTPDLGRVLADARLRAGPHPDLAGFSAFQAAAAGFARRSDPSGGFVWPRPGRDITSSENDFGLGLELDGATGPRWVSYQAAVQGSEAADPPVGVPWRVRRVLPGSAAAVAGLRVGDLITAFDGLPVTPTGDGAAFRRLQSASGSPDGLVATTGSGKPIRIRVTRPGQAAPIDLSLDPNRGGFETVFGVTRRADGRWDHQLDPTAGIGYVRLGNTELANPDTGLVGTDVALFHALQELERDGAAGLVLDLRWCAGGYIDQLMRITSVFVPSSKPLAIITQGRERVPRRYTSETVAGRWLKPVLVLVGDQTVGGGELIAAALQDSGVAVVAGQRTFGRGTHVTLIQVRTVSGLVYKTTTGFLLRPTGVNRHRFPDSKPTDPWGVKPDRGFEIPLSADLSDRLRDQYETDAVRGSHDPGSVGHDALADPQLAVALKLFRERLAKK